MIAFLCRVIHLQNAVVIKKGCVCLASPCPLLPSFLLLLQKHGLHFPVLSLSWPVSTDFIWSLQRKGMFRELFL